MNFNIKKIFLLLSITILLSSFAIPVLGETSLQGSVEEVGSLTVTNEDVQKEEEVETTTLQAGVSVLENVPKVFYGMWRVNAILSDSSSETVFKPTSLDLWNLSRERDVISLTNPSTGASASIVISYVDSDIIKFTKTSKNDNKILVDVVEIKLEGDTFTGINKLTLQTISDIDSSIIKEEKAVYILKGEKISGDSIEDFEG